MTYHGASNNKLSIVETGSVQLDQGFIWAEFRLGGNMNILLVLKGGFEAFLAVQDPLSSHFEV